MAKIKSFPVKSELTLMAEKVKSGSGNFDGLITRWVDKVKLDRWARSRLHSKQDAEDLSQDVLTNIVERIKEFDSRFSNFETWAGWRARAIFRSRIRSLIDDKNPVLRKGWKSASIKGTFIRIDDASDAELSIASMSEYRMFEIMVDDVKRVLNDSPALNSAARGQIIRTLELFASEKSRKEISKSLRISSSQVDRNIVRIREAVMALDKV